MNCLAVPVIVSAALLAPTNMILGSDSLPTTEAAPTFAAASRPASAADHALGVSFYWENDGNFAKPNGATDRHYSAGDAVAVQWQNPWTNDLVSQLPSINEEFAPQTPGVSYAAGAILSLNIYTPTDLTDPYPIYDDRPYAGWTYVGLIVQRANRSTSIPTFEHMELDLGTIGPDGYAGDTQKFVHKRFGFTDPEGWDNQIRDNFGLDFKYQRRWRLDLVSDDNPSKFGVQFIPDAGAVAGTMHDNLSVGGTLRAGWNMPDDSGPNRMRYASDFTRSFARTDGTDVTWSHFLESLSGYLFVRPDGRYVARDATIQGAFFRHSPVTLDVEPFVGELQMGFAIQFLSHWEVGYSQTYSTKEFDGQHGGDSFGAITLTYVSAW